MFFCFRTALVLATFGLGLIVQQKPTTAQTNSKKSAAIDWRVERQGLEFQLGQDLVKIADWSKKNGLARQVSATYSLKFNRDLNRQYLFLPTTESMPDPSQLTGTMQGWQEKINAAKVAHAGRIFELAERALNQDDPAIAYQLLYEVVYHDRDHAEARRILGHKPKNGGWHVDSNNFRTRESSRKHEYLALDNYLIVETAHFKIGSTATEERTRRLATQLELWHTVWRQIFFDYWGSKTLLTKSFNASGKTMRIPGRKFDIFFFENKQQYATLLSPLVPGVGVSSGYYSNQKETSFFFDGDKSAEETWRHELTHQLFRESKGSSPSNVFEKNFVWLDEGVATYAESMVEFEDFVTVGGFEASRTQYARQQALLEKKVLPSAQLNAMSQRDWQSRGDPYLYAQSAAIVDMLMNGQHGRQQHDLIELLRVIYRRQAKPNSFFRKLNLSFDEVDQQLLQFLKIDENALSKYLSKPETRTFLILSGAKLTDSDYRTLGKCVNLQVLDLSDRTLKAQDLRPLSNCSALHQLILLRCQFEPNALLTLSKLPGLTKVDISLSQIGPSQANEIVQLKQLKPGLVVIQ